MRNVISIVSPIKKNFETDALRKCLFHLKNQGMLRKCYVFYLFKISLLIISLFYF